MQDNGIIPIFARSPADSHQKQISVFIARRLCKIFRSPQILKTLQAAQALNLAEPHTIQMVEQTPFGWVPYDDYIQAIDLVSQPERPTVKSRSATTSPSAESFPERPVIIAVPNSAPIATLHFIEVNVFHHRQPPRQVWEELWERNIFMPLDTMLGILQQWRVIFETALFRLPTPAEAVSPAFHIILERYHRLAQRGQRQHLRESWQLLRATLNAKEHLDAFSYTQILTDPGSAHEACQEDLDVLNRVYLRALDEIADKNRRLAALPELLINR